MTAAEFDRWSVHSVAGFVRQQVAAGLQPEADARRDAARVFAEQLPDGRDTEHHHVLRVQDPATGATVGSLWLRVRPGAGEVEGYVFDVELLPAARGRGLGRATMLAAHETARALGATVMRLNVFGHNAPAIALYASLGYEVADALDAPPPRRPARPVRPGRRDPADDAPGARAFAAHLEEPLRRLLPDGAVTPGQLLWTAYDGTDPVARRVARPGGPVGRAARRSLAGSRSARTCVGVATAGPSRPRPCAPAGRWACAPSGCRSPGPTRRPARSARSWGSASLRRRWCCR